MLDLIRTPEQAVEVTLQPLRRFDLDAAIIFADILPPLVGMGVDLEFAKGEGPVIGNPVRTRGDIERLVVPPPEENVPFILDAIAMARRELDGQVPLIGFSGAPFTLASYLVEGGSSRNYLHTKRLMYGDARGWHLLLDKLARLVGEYLQAQVRAGAQAVQIFDSWAGCLSPADYRDWVLPYTLRAIAPVREMGVPVIQFSTGTAGIVLGAPDLLRETGATVTGVDWRVDLHRAWEALGYDMAIQGNLDPVVLFAGLDQIERQAAHILSAAAGRPGHIFNLGHGILPDTPIENVRALVEFVHEWSK